MPQVKMYPKAVWLVQLEDVASDGGSGRWFTVWRTDEEVDLRTGILYATGKVLDGSDARAFRVVRVDRLTACEY